jgi:hypothetical protein
VSWAYNNTVSDNNTADRNFSFLQSLRRDGNIQSIQQSLQWKNHYFDYLSSLIESHVHEFLVELFLLHFAVFNLLVKFENKIMPRKQPVAAAGEGSATQRRSGRSSADGPRSLDQRQRERARLARIASLERDNHQQDNTHMMKEQVGWLLFIENQIIPPGSF